MTQTYIDINKKVVLTCHFFNFHYLAIVLFPSAIAASKEAVTL